jgi:hypothetical protein
MPARDRRAQIGEGLRASLEERDDRGADLQEVLQLGQEGLADCDGGVDDDEMVGHSPLVEVTIKED